MCFRPVFARVHELRSLLSSNTPMLAATAIGPVKAVDVSQAMTNKDWILKMFSGLSPYSLSNRDNSVLPITKYVL